MPYDLKAAEDWAGKHPILLAGGIIGGGLVLLYFFGYFSSSGSSSSTGSTSSDSLAAAYYAAEAAQTTAGTNLQIAQSGYSAQTAIANINAGANENIQADWATANTAANQDQLSASLGSDQSAVAIAGIQYPAMVQEAQIAGQTQQALGADQVSIAQIGGNTATTIAGIDANAGITQATINATSNEDIAAINGGVAENLANINAASAASSASAAATIANNATLANITSATIGQELALPGATGAVSFTGDINNLPVSVNLAPGVLFTAGQLEAMGAAPGQIKAITGSPP